MDPILYWNDVALQANLESHTNGKNEQTGPPLSSRALAVVHLAMYDAFAGVSRDPVNLPPYLPGLTAPPGAALDAAVAGAAHTTLVSLFPSQKASFDAKLAQAGLPPAGYYAGIGFGITVAQAILKDRKDDPGSGDAGFVVPAKRGGHRPDPDSPGQGHYAPFYGNQSKCFAVSAPHTLADPPALDSKAYLDALREVADKGTAAQGPTVASSNRRTSEETVIGLFWAYDGASGLGTPPRLYNQIVREIATRRTPVNSPAQNARLFALVNVAMADAGILAWREKYRHNLWRPVLGIREHDPSIGPDGTGQPTFDDEGDCTWLPQGAPSTNVVGKKNATPNFPAYPSGHATFGAAAFQITRLFYDRQGALEHKPDNLTNGMTFVSDELNGVNTDNKGTVRPRHVRRFDGGLWKMIEENGLSRVYLGVHWVYDAFAVKNNGKPDLTQNVGGVPLGLKIAEDIFQ
ncbi:MAG TPA: phosphatase PAP2 family protein, partial [Acidimicrobiales bacterium]|nr:phosphatase PAP2 family protein [Acidimicrobiales bacterium]